MIITLILLFLIVSVIFGGSGGLFNVILKGIVGFFHMLFMLCVYLFAFKILFRGLSNILGGNVKSGMFSVISSIVLIAGNMIFLSKKVNSISLWSLLLFVILYYVGRIYVESTE